MRKEDRQILNEICAIMESYDSMDDYKPSYFRDRKDESIKELTFYYLNKLRYQPDLFLFIPRM